MKTILRSAIAALALMICAGNTSAWAIRPDEVLANPKLEARARSIGQELRCLVCQNESIDDSDADLAHDLRVLVRQRLLAGDTDEQVKAYIVARYGNYVLLKPPLFSETYLLWFGPAVLLMGGAVAAIIYYRGNTKAANAVPLSPDEEARLAALMAGDRAGDR